MIAPPKPHNERQRLETLHSLHVLYTVAEERFDRITRMASKVFNVPVALVGLLDGENLWFKSRHGFALAEISRENSFCGHAILQDDILVVEDALNDQRFADNPLVTAEPDIRFYAGCPLSAPNGTRLGTLSIMDSEPRQVSDEELYVLRELASMVEAELFESRYTTTDELTGLSNLLGFEMMAAQSLALCQRQNWPASLLYLRLKDTGEIAEQAGADAVGQALVEFSRIMLRNFRGSDVIGRVGRDEFAVLLTGADQSGTKSSLGRLRYVLRDHNLDETRRLALSIDAAIANYDSDEHDSASALIRAADEELQRQKGTERESAKRTASA